LEQQSPQSAGCDSAVVADAFTAAVAAPPQHSGQSGQKGQSGQAGQSGQQLSVAAAAWHELSAQPTAVEVSSATEGLTKPVPTPATVKPAITITPTNTFASIEILQILHCAHAGPGTEPNCSASADTLLSAGDSASQQSHVQWRTFRGGGSGAGATGRRICKGGNLGDGMAVTGSGVDNERLRLGAFGPSDGCLLTRSTQTQQHGREGIDEDLFPQFESLQDELKHRNPQPRLQPAVRDLPDLADGLQSEQQPIARTNRRQPSGGSVSTSVASNNRTCATGRIAQFLTHAKAVRR
jgi:hypothetical protein